jgi:hypothetical protein
VLPWSLPGVVVLARWNDGTEASAYFRGDGARVVVELGALRAAAGSRWQLASRYFGLGWEHILFGIDHLLFVAGLLLLVHGAGTLVKTITAFTVAHSITLGVAALGYVRVPAAPVEAAIALSIVLLARELVVGTAGRVHLIHRRPWIVAFVFGLLHGFGFAGALGDLGLRAGDVPLALLFFNLGVEAGQLAFVRAALAALALASSAFAVRGRAAAADFSGASWRPAVQLAIGYAIGVIATRWLIERLPALGA